MKGKDLLFHPSSVGTLLTNPKLKKDQQAGNLSVGAKTYVKKLWLFHEHGCKMPVITDQMQKGNLVEQDTCPLLDIVIPAKEKRKINIKEYRNDFFIGTMDIALEYEKIIEDVKASYTKETFQAAAITKLQYVQVLCYIDLMRSNGKDYNSGRINYCMMNTPAHLLSDLKQRFWYKLDCDETGDTLEYEIICDQLEKLHLVKGMTEQERVKSYEFVYNNSLMIELKKRIGKAREYYDTIKINQIDTSDITKLEKLFPPTI